MESSSGFTWTKHGISLLHGHGQVEVVHNPLKNPQHRGAQGMALSPKRPERENCNHTPRITKNLDAPITGPVPPCNRQFDTILRSILVLSRSYGYKVTS